MSVVCGYRSAETPVDWTARIVHHRSRSDSSGSDRSGAERIVMFTGFRVSADFFSELALDLHRQFGVHVRVECLAGHETAEDEPYCMADAWMCMKKVERIVEEEFREEGRPVVLVAHSLAGLLCLRLAASRPEMVKSMILIAPAIDIGSFLYTSALAVINALHRLVGGDHTKVGRRVRMMQIVPPEDWENWLLKLAGRILVKLHLFPPYIWEPDSIRSRFTTASSAAGYAAGYAGGYAGGYAAVSSGLKEAVSVLRSILVVWRLRFSLRVSVSATVSNTVRASLRFVYVEGMWASLGDRASHTFGGIFRCRASWLYSWRSQWRHPRLAGANIATSTPCGASTSRWLGRSPGRSNRKAFAARRYLTMPFDWDWEKHRQLWSVKRFARVPLVSAASIPPFQVEVLRQLNQVRCPVLLSHGTDDWVIPFGASKWLKEELEQHGVQVRLSPIVGGTHGFLLNRDYYLEARAEMCSWLRMQADPKHFDAEPSRVRYFLLQSEESSYVPMAERA